MAGKGQAQALSDWAVAFGAGFQCKKCLAAAGGEPDELGVPAGLADGLEPRLFVGELFLGVHAVAASAG